MASLANVVLRGGILHFRRAVPAALRTRLRRAELVRSLETGRRPTARIRGCRLYVLSEELFAAARTDMLDETELTRLVAEFYTSVLAADDADRLAGIHPVPRRLVEARRAFYGKVAARSREALAEDRFGDAGLIAVRLLARQRVSTASFSVADWNRVRQAVLRAGIDVAEAMRARCAGDFVHERRAPRLRQILDETGRPAGASAAAEPSAAPRAEAPGPAAQRAAAATAPMPACDVSEPRAGVPDAAPAAPPLSALWPDFCGQQVASGGWEKQAASQARPSFRLFVEICGDRSPAAYTRKDVGYFKDRVERLPASYGKAALCLSKLRRAVPGRTIIRDEKFWLPLIAVFSGMRQEEICQLSLEDVRETNGIAYFDINDRGARTLKNRTTVRRVPVHDELVRLKLLRRVEALRGKREMRLFPELRGGGADDSLGHK